MAIRIRRDQKASGPEAATAANNQGQEKAQKTLSLLPNQGQLDSLDKTLEGINKYYGAGTLNRLEEGSVYAAVRSFPSGSLSLDRALGVGGYPLGRIIECYGPESSGKTTLALHAIASIQSLGGVAAFIDAEHALDPKYAKNLGVDLSKLLISQPDSGEQALEIADRLVHSGSVSLIVIDSVAALTPKAELEGEMGDTHVGLQARLMSQALRKLTGAAQKSGTTLFFLNQIRMKIGVMFGSPETTTGGNALKFYASVRMDVRRIGGQKGGDDKVLVANKTRVKVVKNKVAPPFKEAEFEIYFGEGIDRYGELLDMAAEHDIIEKSGSWYSYQGERMGQGRENATKALQRNEDMYQEILAVVREVYSL